MISNILRKSIFSFAFLLSIVYTSVAQVGKEELKTQNFKASAYCHTGLGCTKGISNGKTATGTKVRVGVIAVDPKVIKLRSRVEILHPSEVAGIYTASDVGGRRIHGNFIDIWMPTRKQAMTFGIKNVVLRVLPKNYVEKKNDILKESEQP